MLVESKSPDFDKYETYENGSIVIQLDAVDETPWYFVVITDLPSHGKLFQYDPNNPPTYKGTQIITTAINEEEISQWVKSVGNNSGSYGGYVPTNTPWPFVPNRTEPQINRLLSYTNQLGKCYLDLVVN